MSGIGLENNETFTTPGDDTQHIVTVDVAYVNVFFDGTENNYFNTLNESKAGRRGSYLNALSNVARMYAALRLQEWNNAVYIDGIGTTQGQDDSTRGKAFGTGETGIEARARSAFGEILKKLKKFAHKSSIPALVNLNVFGFSRGAATARRFIHLVKTEKENFGDEWQSILVRVNFVGLFDTVSSYAPGLDLNFGNDVQQLHLDFGAGYANKVFQLVALDEYRANFAVTTIESACKQTLHNHNESCRVGYELHIPGAHSDVGGGYQERVSETRELGPFTSDFVFEKGWFPKQGGEGFMGTTHTRTITSDYYKVALSLMVDQAHAHTSVVYPEDLTAPSVHADIQAVQSLLRAFAKDENNTRWDLDDKLGPDKARAFRRQFLHLSFEDATVANSPRREGGSNATATERTGSAAQVQGPIIYRQVIPG